MRRPTAQRIGVDIDTSRYGHYAAFLGDDLQAATAELQFAESADGYARFRQRIEQLAGLHGPVSFAVRLDAVGQYADNLLQFLHRLGTPDGGLPLASSLTVCCGDPQRNKNYRAALFGPKKSDPIEAQAAVMAAVSRAFSACRHFSGAPTRLSRPEQLPATSESASP